MSEHTWTMVAEGKCIKKRPSDNYNNQSFEKELAMRNEMDNEEKIKDARYDKYKYSGRPIGRRPKRGTKYKMSKLNISKRTV